MTGANRGIGPGFTRALPARGAAKVYASVRRPEDFTEPGAEAVRLDAHRPRSDRGRCSKSVVGVHVGYAEAHSDAHSDADADATVTVDAPKVEAVEVVAKTMDAISHDEPEVSDDETARQVRAALSGPLELLYPTA
ncbi:hypothetical protein ABT072_43425 [Streptomyces sp. NPDC002589]|uniref:hypothetical protein n=1 Tax=Streptomyces sp. NPDC002589 TaxID=3154420 RepID=UPI00332C3C96